jgi:hypothetical protein
MLLARLVGPEVGKSHTVFLCVTTAFAMPPTFKIRLRHVCDTRDCLETLVPAFSDIDEAHVRRHEAIPSGESYSHIQNNAHTSCSGEWTVPTPGRHDPPVTYTPSPIRNNSSSRYPKSSRCIGISANASVERVSHTAGSSEEKPTNHVSALHNDWKLKTTTAVDEWRILSLEDF